MVLGQSLKASEAILGYNFLLGLGMDILVRLEHPLKAFWPIDVTELPMVTEVRPLQSQKAAAPMDVTELGMVTEVRLVQP